MLTEYYYYMQFFFTLIRVVQSVSRYWMTIDFLIQPQPTYAALVIQHHCHQAHRGGQAAVTL